MNVLGINKTKITIFSAIPTPAEAVKPKTLTKANNNRYEISLQKSWKPTGRPTLIIDFNVVLSIIESLLNERGNFLNLK